MKAKKFENNTFESGQMLVEMMISLAMILLILICAGLICGTGLKELHKNSYVERVGHAR